MGKAVLDIELVEGGTMPVKMTKGAACYDCFARTDVAVFADKPVLIPLGFKVAIPDGKHIKLFLRSGMSYKTSLRIANCVGIIDSDYRGEVCLIAEATSNGYEYIKAGTRICQFLVEDNIETELNQVDSLPETERGDGGFGSTDNKK